MKAEKLSQTQDWIGNRNEIGTLINIKQDSSTIQKQVAKLESICITSSQIETRTLEIPINNH